MNKTSLVILVYIIGLIFAALFLDLWGAETGPKKALIGITWTAIFLIALFYVEKDKND